MLSTCREQDSSLRHVLLQYERILGKALMGRGRPAEHWAHSEYAWLVFEGGDLQVRPAAHPNSESLGSSRHVVSMRPVRKCGFASCLQPPKQLLADVSPEKASLPHSPVCDAMN